MYFKDLELIPDQSKNDLHYHADYIEILTLSCGEDGLRFSCLNDKYKPEQVQDFIEIIRERASSFEEKYPFTMDGNLGLSKLSTPTMAQSLYVFLLLCSHTNKTTVNSAELRSKFELISKIALSHYLPSLAVCHNIGKSSNQNGRYVGSIVDKLNKLAEDLRCFKMFEDDDFSLFNSGDLGLDVVAWVPFSGDLYFHKIMQTYLCQCATGKDWVKKQAEPEKVKNVLKMPKATVDTLFVPYDLRKTNGSFHNFHDITINLLFDRRRILNLLINSEEGLAAIENVSTTILDIMVYEPGLVD